MFVFVVGFALSGDALTQRETCLIQQLGLLGGDCLNDNLSDHSCRECEPKKAKPTKLVHSDSEAESETDYSGSEWESGSESES